jgi:UDPglucose 6-dehydrogenase
MVMHYSVVGLGKLGASMAAAIASRGFNVIGLDVNPQAVEAVNAGRAPVQETALAETIGANRERLRATLDVDEAIRNSDVTFVIVPTPSDTRGAFSLRYTAASFGAIGRALAHKRTYHLVVLTSTVLPGATRYGLLPILERASGKTCGADFGLCYSPEFVALGSVIRDFLYPDFNLIGEFDARSGDVLEACYSSITATAPPCRRMSIENAELTKVALNTFVTTKITFANMLADMCERIPGGDVDVVTGALGLDSRIGRKYLTGALGYGGPCFPRDNVALGFMARALDTEATLAEATDKMNRALATRVVARLQPMLRRGTTVAVLGLAYKPDSHVLEESQGVAIAEALAETGAQVIAYDPLANHMACHELRACIMVADSAVAALRKADIVVITTPEPAFRMLKAVDFIRPSHVITVLDCWRILASELTGQQGVNYIPLGRSTHNATNAARLADLWTVPL